jgi:hypothetical protein
VEGLSSVRFLPMPRRLVRPVAASVPCPVSLVDSMVFILKPCDSLALIADCSANNSLSCRMLSWTSFARASKLRLIIQGMKDAAKPNLETEPSAHNIIGQGICGRACGCCSLFSSAAPKPQHTCLWGASTFRED